MTRLLGIFCLLLLVPFASALLRAFIASIRGRLGRNRLDGVHVERGEEIRIEGSGSSVLLDGEYFEATLGRPIVLRPRTFNSRCSWRHGRKPIVSTRAEAVSWPG